MKALQVLCVLVLISCGVLGLRWARPTDALYASMSRWEWLRSRVVESDPEHFDYVFIGSSKTLVGLDAIEIEAGLPGKSAINLAHYQFGHDADYYIVEALLARHTVGTLVIEIYELWPDVPHRAVPQLVGIEDIPAEVRLLTRSLSWSDILSYDDPWKESLTSLSSMVANALLAWPSSGLEDLVSPPASAAAELDPLREPAAGSENLRAWREFQGQQRRPLSELWEDREFAREHQDQPKRAPIPPVARPRLALELPAPGSRSDFYLHAIRALAEQSGTKLVFLVVPRWNQRPPPFETYDYYYDFGEVLVTDLTDMAKLAYYFDNRHLTAEGGQSFSREVVRLLRQGDQSSLYWKAYHQNKKRRDTSRRTRKIE